MTLWKFYDAQIPMYFETLKFMSCKLLEGLVAFFVGCGGSYISVDTVNFTVIEKWKADATDQLFLLTRQGHAFVGLVTSCISAESLEFWKYCAFFNL